MILRRFIGILSVYIVIILLIFSITLIYFGSKDKENGKWIKKASMPTSRHSLAVTSLNGKIYAIGGVVRKWYNSFERLPISPPITNIVEIYDPKTDTWSQGTPMPTNRHSLAVTSLNGKIYAIGGSNDAISELNTVEIYDPKTDTWSQGTPIPTPRVTMGIATLNNKIYLIGGYSIKTNFTNIVEIYDPKTDTWSQGTPMTTSRSRLATISLNGKIYAIGGYFRPYLNIPQQLGIQNIVEIYDPKTDTWSQGTHMPTPRRNLGLTTLNGKIYAIGGFGPPHNTVEIYDPITNKWGKGENMPTQRYELGVTTLNGKIYAIGGLNPIIPSHFYIQERVVEEYNP